MGKRIRPVQKYAVKIFLPAALYRSQSEARLLARHRGARLRAGEVRARRVQAGGVTWPSGFSGAQLYQRPMTARHTNGMYTNCGVAREPLS